MIQSKVITAIESERKYQKAKYGKSASSNRPGDGSRTLDEYALYIYGIGHDLAMCASHGVNPDKKLEYVRKIAALCIGCMEEHGAPLREEVPQAVKPAATSIHGLYQG